MHNLYWKFGYKTEQTIHTFEQIKAKTLKVVDVLKWI
jgi:hypothetical protein